MIITYMIGNGLDISLGLKTRYTDFYEYIKNKYSDNEIRKNEILDSIDSDTELWSDLELGLGEYTKNIEDDTEKLNKFYKDKFEIDIMLREYLKIEQDKINWDDKEYMDKFKTEFVQQIVYFYNYFKTTDKTEINKLIGGQSLKYYLISFNYTDVIKQGIQINKSADIEEFYLHGTLEGEDAILGVNDSEQIKNQHFNSKHEMLLSMCKIERNNYIGENKTKRGEEILDTSAIVCIFGMLIGETDKHWWEKVVDNLKRGVTQMIIIFHYKTNLDKRDYVEVWREEERVKEQLLKYASEGDEPKSSLKDKIKVICNSDMFKLQLKFKNNPDLDELVKEKSLIS